MVNILHFQELAVQELTVQDRTVQEPSGSPVFISFMSVRGY